MDEVMTAEEVARALKVQVRVVRGLVARGKLRGAKIGKEWRFRRADVEALLSMGGAG